MWAGWRRRKSWPGTWNCGLDALLDVGSGLGGPARYFAAEHGCRVTGIDLTEEFVRAADNLTKRTKLDVGGVSTGSALELPFERDTFDRAYMIHVGMNITDKAGIFREVRRVLKPEGLFTIFDMMRTGDGAIRYPVPWALSEETSFVATVKEYRDALQGAGFRIAEERGRGPFAIAFTERMMARMAQGGPPALGLHLLMGEKTPVIVGNILAAMKEGVSGAVELHARACNPTARCGFGLAPEATPYNSEAKPPTTSARRYALWLVKKSEVEYL